VPAPSPIDLDGHSRRIPTIERKKAFRRSTRSFRRRRLLRMRASYRLDSMHAVHPPRCPFTRGCELRRRARTEGKSLNAVAIEVLIRGTGLTRAPVRMRDLSAIAGTLQEDPELGQAASEQDRIDEQLWR
jgi:hypothetical protein